MEEQVKKDIAREVERLDEVIIAINSIRDDLVDDTTSNRVQNYQRDLEIDVAITVLSDISTALYKNLRHLKCLSQ